MLLRWAARWSLHAHINSSLLGRFVSLQTLKDSSSRALYDHHLSQAELKATVVLHEELDLNEMELQEQLVQLQEQAQLPIGQQRTQHRSTPDDIGGHACKQAQQHQQYMYSYPCRCGEQYVLQSSELQLAAGEVIIPCRCVVAKQLSCTSKPSHTLKCWHSSGDPEMLLSHSPWWTSAGGYSGATP